ncbi:hypothetical protein SPI_04683 [Niveomyces insectorum RCEF 264]|uniref:Uncharacterized protein n=1 Tax=Niveomyces insectorum RCEF 264 TaxID=1081102 RepID=A0A167URB4_9HYPO|nr:hypothetical protein SPI_04683 [Niveomyces insectorum RCEF 264]
MGLLGGLSPGGSIALGIAVGIVSTSVQSLGLTLQRKSHILEDEKAPHLVRRPPHRRRRWQLGMAMFVVANLVGSSIQISTLPLPVLSTLQASGLVFNSICATLILGEPFTRWSLWGTLLVCGGAVLIAVFGAIPAPAHNLDELLALLARPPFIAWMALQAVSVVGVAVCIELASAFFSGSLPPPLSSSRSTSSFSSSSRTAHTARFRLARGLTYGCISGVLSAHSLLVAKSAVELVVRTIADGNNQFRHWQAWALVLALVTLALTQLYYLHRGLKLVSTSVLYPLVFCVYNIIAILDGLIYFRQTDLIGPLRGCLISLGTVVLLSGVLALSWRLSDEQHAPAVGQSSLAPGLGLVEDSEGEDVYDDGFGAATDDNDNDDDEETLLLGSDISSDDIAIIDANDEERVTGFGRGRLARGGKRISMVEGDGTAERQRLLPPRKRYVSSYQTFAFGQLENVAKTTTAAAAAEREHVFSPTSPTLGRRRTVGAVGGMPQQHTRDARWTERAEIWDELEDQDDRQRSSFEAARGPATKRYRSSTLPLLIGSSAPPPTQLQARTPPGQASLSPFSAARRGISGWSPSLLRASNNNNYNNGNHSRAASSGAVDSGGGGGGNTAADAVAGYRKAFRRRRKTTGFPGFHARRIDRRSFSEGGGGGGSSSSSRPTTTGLQDALGGLWRLGWWHGDHSNRNGGGSGGSGGNDDGDGSKGKQHSPVTLVSSSPLVPHHEGPPNAGRELHRGDEDSTTTLPAHAPPSNLGDDSDDDLDDG